MRPKLNPIRQQQQPLLLSRRRRRRRRKPSVEPMGRTSGSTAIAVMQPLLLLPWLLMLAMVLPMIYMPSSSSSSSLSSSASLSQHHQTMFASAEQLMSSPSTTTTTTTMKPMSSSNDETSTTTTNSTYHLAASSQAHKLARRDELDESTSDQQPTIPTSAVRPTTAQAPKRRSQSVNRSHQQYQAKQQQQQQQQSNWRKNAPIEFELLPFSHFTVQQPSFGEIMRSWPSNPKRMQQQQLLQEQQQQQRQQSHHRADCCNKNRQDSARSSDALISMASQRNHLNEDLDDTAVTADQSFELDSIPEPPTWINYLAEMGHYVHDQLTRYFDHSLRSPTTNSSSTTTRQSVSIETIDELLDDFYYDQYENSQVLYYGPQLAREGSTVEIGCYLPTNQPAEWSKSGRSALPAIYAPRRGTGESPGPDASASAGNPSAVLLMSSSAASMSAPTPRTIRRSDFLGGKQNYSLKIFEALPSDTGNYRCTRMSRKYHKLVVVPARTTDEQLYVIQQRLLAVLDPKQVVSSGGSGVFGTPDIRRGGSTISSSSAAAIASGRIISDSTAALRQYYGTSAAHNGYYFDSEQQQNNEARLYAQAAIAANGARRLAAAEAARLAASSPQNKWPHQQQQLLPILMQAHLIVESQPLIVNCNISDEFVLRKLRENPQFQLSWFKNGKRIRSSSAMNNRRQQQQMNPGAMQHTIGRANGNQPASAIPVLPATTSGAFAGQQRVQFLQPNGRQLYISSASQSDAGDYLCSWSELPTGRPTMLTITASGGDINDNASNNDEPPGGFNSASDSSDGFSPAQSQSAASSSYHAHTAGGRSTFASSPITAGSQMQLIAPVRLRPFRSAYYARAGDQLRLVCFASRGHPPARLVWYAGNRLVDGDFLQQNAQEYRILQWDSSNGLQAFGAAANNTALTTDDSGQVAPEDGSTTARPRIVEINPIPVSRGQQLLAANGADSNENGQWVEYREMSNEKYAVDSLEQQNRYIRMKIDQLVSTQAQMQSNTAPAGNQNAAQSTLQAGVLEQASISVLIINALDVDTHTSRYACRATNRANTDEVTTVIRVKAASTIVVRPTNGMATIVPGQALHFECKMIGNKDADYVWYHKAPSGDQGEVLLEPNTDDAIEIHNTRLTLHRPTSQSAGDYICRALDNDKTKNNQSEFAIIHARMQPYIEDFNIETSHTGKSTVVTDGDRLELICTVPDTTSPVNITWLRSKTPDDERTMVPLVEIDTNSTNSAYNQGRTSGSTISHNQLDPFDTTANTYTAASEQNVFVEALSSHSKRLVIETVKLEHRSYYVCMVDNGVSEPSQKMIFIRVKDRIVALWPFLGIVAELFILFTIIHVWETQRAYKTMQAGGSANSTTASPSPIASNKRPASGATVALESVPLTSG